MSRPYKPKELPGLMPYIMVQDPEATLAFYQKTFQFEVFGEPIRQKDGKIMHAEVRFHDAVIMFGAEGEFQTPRNSGIKCPVGLYIYCEDVDGFYKHAVENGAKSVSGPEDMFWGDRMCRLEDPDGYIWSFATNVAEFDPAKVPT